MMGLLTWLVLDPDVVTLNNRMLLYLVTLYAAHYLNLAIVFVCRTTAFTTLNLLLDRWQDCFNILARDSGFLVKSLKT